MRGRRAAWNAEENVQPENVANSALSLLVSAEVNAVGAQEAWGNDECSRQAAGA
jgi:hypothetical protein